MNIIKIEPEKLRLLEDVAVAYDTWMQALRGRDDLGAALAWRTLDGQEYLYERIGGEWGSSQGPRSAQTEQQYASRTQEIAGRDEVIAGTRQRLDLLSRQYRALRMPRVHPTLGAICREADRRGLLGTALMVVGTNSMPAYEIEAQHSFPEALRATADCDLAWTGDASLTLLATSPTPVYSLLKAVDRRFTVNSEKNFQARDAGGYEVEILLGQSLAADYPRRDPLRPLPLEEQDWLLHGERVSHVVFDQGNLPARLVVPDPRWMALHKMWLADQPKRNVLKRDKDREQGRLLAYAVATYMWHLPLDDGFRAMVPAPLQRYLELFPQAVKPG